MYVHIPWPSRWARIPRETRWGVGLAGAFVALLLVVAVATAANGQYVLTLAVSALVLITATLAAHAGFVALTARRRGQSVVQQVELLATSGRAVAIPHSQPATITYLAFMLTLGVTLALMPVVAAVTPYEGTTRDVYYRVFAWAVAPLLAIPALGTVISRVLRKRTLLGIGLSPDGVYHWSWFGCCFFQWNWIKDVSAKSRTLTVDLDIREPLARPVNAEENWYGRLGWIRSKKSRLPVGYLAANPAVALYALAFYHRHPELREELGAARGVDRIQRLEFPDVLDEIREQGDLRPAKERR